MNEWTSGYVADIGYTYGYYQELNPLRLQLAFLRSGLALPSCAVACELGFGQGISINMHAAAGAGQWHGTDFNPAQAAFARELAGAASSPAWLYDDAFADFGERDDLPDFDFIGLHGIWSWINDRNRATIVDFVRRKLKVGGVLYVSYNTLPGWASFAPMRQLMSEHAEIIGAQGQGLIGRIDEAIIFAEKLLQTNPLYSRANPQVSERLKKLTSQNRGYLAHEYFNRDWLPMHFATMAGWLEPAKLQYACSANYLDHIDTINLTAEQQAFSKNIPDQMFRESVRDFMVNQQFRKDYWVKGVRRLTPLEQAESLRSQRVILTTTRSEVALTFTGSLGEVSMSEQIYTPILDLLAGHKAKTLGQLEQALAEQGIAFAQLIEAVTVLTGAGHLAAVQSDELTAKVKKSTAKLNAHLLLKARSRDDINYLASPVTGGGIAVGRFPQLFLLALSQGRKKPEEWAELAWQVINSQGQKLVKDNVPLATAEENLAELNRRAELFATQQLPVLKALQIQ